MAIDESDESLRDKINRVLSRRRRGSRWRSSLLKYLTPLLLVALSLLYLKAVSYSGVDGIAAKVFTFISSLITFIAAAKLIKPHLIKPDSNIIWIIPTLGALLLVIFASDVELLALTLLSIVLASILLPALITSKNANANVKLVASIVIAAATPLPGLALGQLYYDVTLGSGPDSLAARAVSAIIVFITLMLIKAILLPDINNIIDNNNIIIILVVIFTLIIATLTPAYMLEYITWAAVVGITTSTSFWWALRQVRW